MLNWRAWQVAVRKRSEFSRLRSWRATANDVTSLHMRSVPNGRNHVPEACTPDTGSANELRLCATCFVCAHSWCICTHAKAPRTPITPLIKLKNAAGPARTSAPPHNTHDRTETLKKQKEQNPAHPATSGRSGSPAQKRRSGTKKAGTSKSNANRILPIPHQNAKP